MEQGAAVRSREGGGADVGPPDIFRVGEVLDRVYEIRQLLGAGGMGQVFEAQDLILNRRVAIKSHWRHMRHFSLRREAQALAAIRHPSVATVHGFGSHAGSEYVVMERIWGVSLAEHLARLRRLGQSFAVEEITAMLAQLAEGLAAVHAAGIAHRDVKPANVMLAPRGRLVLMDFGIMLPEYAVMQQEPSPGTAEYMAPESIRRELNPGGAYLVDVYGFGIVGFELLTGRRPFEASPSSSVYAQHLWSTPPALDKLRPDVPRRLLAIIEACLAKDPSDRPQTMDIVASTLRRIDSTLSVRTQRPLSVLVVGDDWDCAAVLAAIVRDTADGAVVNIVHDGEEALQHIQRNAPDLLVLDMGLPGMSGLELCMYLRGTGIADSTAILSVSAGAQAPDVALLHQLGIHQFVPKGTDLVSRVQEVVRGILALR